MQGPSARLDGRLDLARDRLLMVGSTEHPCGAELGSSPFRDKLGRYTRAPPRRSSQVRPIIQSSKSSPPGMDYFLDLAPGDFSFHRFHPLYTLP
jgi:hypothetical protein